MNTAIISFPLFGERFVIDPPAFITIFGFDIYLYGLFITAGFAAAALYLLKRRDVFGLTKDNILDLVIIAVPCGLVGARLYYMLFNFEYYFGPGRWQNIIQFREGGLAVYGGVIGGAIAFIIYARVKKIHIGKLLDAGGFGLFIGQALGRWGNFFNREAYGIETDAPWKMGLKFRRAEYIPSLNQTIPPGETHYFHPAFLYESLWNTAGLVLLHIISKKWKTKYPGQYFLFYVAWYGLGRFMIEGIRIDSLFIPGTDIRVSQALAAASFLIAASILVRNHIRKTTVSVSLAEGEEDPGPASNETVVSEGQAAGDEDTEHSGYKPVPDADSTEDAVIGETSEASEASDETPEETQEDTPEEASDETSEDSLGKNEENPEIIDKIDKEETKNGTL